MAAKGKSPDGLPWGLKLYRGVTWLATPTAKLILRSRAARGPNPPPSVRKFSH